MRREGRLYYPAEYGAQAGRPVRVNLTHTWPHLDAFHRSTIRRNYRWMRRDGLSTVVSRLVLDSTLSAMRDSLRVNA